MGLLLIYPPPGLLPSMLWNKNEATAAIHRIHTLTSAVQNKHHTFNYSHQSFVQPCVAQGKSPKQWIITSFIIPAFITICHALNMDFSNEQNSIHGIDLPPWKQLQERWLERRQCGVDLRWYLWGIFFNDKGCSNVRQAWLKQDMWTLSFEFGLRKKKK